ncbi:MAG: hypothetical protein HZB76_03865 [Chlamydiae bacterium]|nr:hypothetical protein [Chlamydiota bacterium]
MWSVRSNFSKDILSWRSSDTLIIYKNDSFSSWLRGYKYKITNTILNSTVEANVWLNPKIDNSYTLTIANIDKCNNMVTLSDQTNWIIKDTYFNSILSSWIVGDCIIVGTNFPWFWERWDAILINVSMKGTTSAAAHKQ